MGSVTYILKLRDQMSRVAAKAQASLNRTTAAAQRTADSFDLIGIAAGSVVVAGLFKMGAELEQTTLLFNTLTGSVEKGTKLFEDLTEFANTTPFSNEALNKNARTLLAFGAEAEEVERNLRMLGDVAAGDSERLSRLTLAFAQSRSAARLMGQDLLQFINAGFNPLQIISEKTGKSMLELKKQMEKGLIPFRMVEEAFRIATAEGGRFHGLTETMATTMKGKWSTALGKGRFLISELGLSMKEIFTPFIDGIIKAIDFMSKYRKIIFPVLQILTVFTGTLIGIVAAMKLWIAAQKILNTLLIANPVGLIVTAIAALVAIIVVAWKKSENFRRVVFGVWEVIKLLANTVWTVIQRVFSPLVEVFKALFKWFKKAGKALKTGFFEVLEKANYELFIKNNINLAESFQRVSDKAKLAGDAIKQRFPRFGKWVDKQLEIQEMQDKIIAGTAGASTSVAKEIVDAFKKGAEKAKGGVDPLFKTGGALPDIPGLDLSEDLKKLQAEGVVSGGIKTFNINIGTLTGVETMTTTTIQEGAEAVGRAFRDSLLSALADIKDI
jgi:tape measure domain-containing protein